MTNGYNGTPEITFAKWTVRQAENIGIFWKSGQDYAYSSSQTTFTTLSSPLPRLPQAQEGGVCWLIQNIG